MPARWPRCGTIAETRGGFVSQVATTGTPGRQRSDLVVRVPQGEFFDTLESIKGLGKVWAENAGSEDVTEQFIDLEAPFAKRAQRRAELAVSPGARRHREQHLEP